MRTTLVALIGFFGLLLNGCGGGGDDGGSSTVAPPTAPTITISGTATFDRVPTSASGLNYAGTVIQPIRGATVQIRSGDGVTILSQGLTSATGTYSITAPGSTAIRVVVRATLGVEASPNTTIIDNTTGDAVYALSLSRTTGVGNETGVNLHAASGWGGSAYTTTRAAGPFAILDTIYDAQTLIRSADSAVVFPAVSVRWSINNSSALIGTSNYSQSTKAISILGKADEDTDEYDDHVVAHEWGHYFEANFSRTDSMGGAHGTRDVLDESVAFGEGWGNAFSGMVLRNPAYRDTAGVGQSSNAVNLALEADAIPDGDIVGVSDPRLFDGGWSETSVQEILWDIFDGSATAGDADADGVDLGFTPLYQVFTGAQKTTRGFTNIYSFLHHLKASRSSEAAAIAALAAAENIGTHDDLGQSASGYDRTTVVPPDGVPVTMDLDGDLLTTYNTYGPITVNNPGNRLYNWMYFKTTIATAGTYRLRVAPLTGTNDVVVVSGGPDSLTFDAVVGGNEITPPFTATAGEVLVYRIGSFNGAVPFTVTLGTPAQVSKPQPPRGDG